MSMSKNVVGFKPPDATWQRMKAVWDACRVANVPVPTEVEDFFNGDAPDPAGVVVDIEGESYVTEWNGVAANGFEVDLKQVPGDITILRFYNSW